MTKKQDILDIISHYKARALRAERYLKLFLSGYVPVMNYKDYQGTIEYSVDDKVFFGKVVVEDLVSYEGDNIEELNSNFKNSVDEYIAVCKEIGKESNENN